MKKAIQNGSPTTEGEGEGEAAYEAYVLGQVEQYGENTIVQDKSQWLEVHGYQTDGTAYMHVGLNNALDEHMYRNEALVRIDEAFAALAVDEAVVAQARASEDAQCAIEAATYIRERMVGEGVDPEAIRRAMVSRLRNVQGGRQNEEWRRMQARTQGVRQPKLDEGAALLSQINGKVSYKLGATLRRLAELETAAYEQAELARTIKRLQEGHQDMVQRMYDIKVDSYRAR